MFSLEYISTTIITSSRFIPCFAFLALGAKLIILTWLCHLLVCYIVPSLCQGFENLTKFNPGLAETFDEKVFRTVGIFYLLHLPRKIFKRFQSFGHFFGSAFYASQIQPCLSLSQVSIACLLLKNVAISLLPLIFTLWADLTLQNMLLIIRAVFNDCRK